MRTVTVTGHGSAAAVPDSAVLLLSVVHQAPSLTDALAGAESARSAAVAALRRTPGVGVGSSGLSVWPATDDRGRAAGFTAEHSLTVRCPGLEQAGALVEAAADAAGDRLRVQAVNLVVADPGPALLAAREAAFGDAGARAAHLAGLAGAALGDVESVVEGGASVPLALHRDAMAYTSSVTFEPGETTVTSSVVVVFALLTTGFPDSVGSGSAAQAGPTSVATWAAPSPTKGSPAPGVADAPTV